MAGRGPWHCSNSIDYPFSFIFHPLASCFVVASVQPYLCQIGLVGRGFPLSYLVACGAFIIVIIVIASSFATLGGDSAHFQLSSTFSFNGMPQFLYE